ncbi:hypothetical protein [Hydrogenophaga palleronii]|uniref:hypothetical protein n=1 Tax=Hydrogenophaga palleronii TaxID=65655 RepID=UPI000826C5D0|nr:hypothetical protein [Hydrogenophaga palleronii]
MSSFEQLLAAVPTVPASRADAAQARAWLDEVQQLVPALQTGRAPGDAGAALARRRHCSTACYQAGWRTLERATGWRWPTPCGDMPPH